MNVSSACPRLTASFTTGEKPRLPPGKPPSSGAGHSSLPTASLFLPKEHGSWSLALEPLALGLLIAPSQAGFALAATALAGFFVRRPLKTAFAPVFSERRREAREAVCLFGSLIIAGVLEAMVLGEPAALWPLLLAVPFGGLFAYFDSQGDSRAAAAEVAGSTAFALLPATFATLAGWGAPAALALAVLSLTRSVPTVLTIRTYLRLRKNQGTQPLIPLTVATLALAASALLALNRHLPWLAVAAAALLALRTIWLVTPLRPSWTARRMGMIEAVLGAAFIALVAGAYHHS